MKRILLAAEITLLLTMSAAFVYVIYTVHQLAPRVEIAIDQISAAALQASATLNQVRHIAMDERKRYDEQVALTEAILRKTGKVLDDTDRVLASLDDYARQLNAAIVTTHQQINQNLLPQATVTLQTVQQLLHNSDEHLAQLSDTLNHRLADQRLDAMLQNLLTSTDQLAGSAKDVHDMTTQLDFKLRQMLTPGRLVWRALRFVLGVGHDVGSIITAAK